MTEKQCYPCTACCEGWLEAEIRGIRLSPMKPCAHLSDSGCGIYEERPEKPCRTFKCAWLQEEYNLPEHMRPSESGSIVLLDRNWEGRKVIRAIPVGEKIPTATLDWLMAFAREKSLPLIFYEYIMKDGKFSDKRVVGYGPPSFVREVEAKVGLQDILNLQS
jgi:hypothetical protein